MLHSANLCLPPRGRGTTKWWKEPAEHKILLNFIVYALSLTRLRRELPPGGSLMESVAV